MREGNGYLGSSSLQTSTANMELIPPKPEWTNGYLLYSFGFMNDQDCTVKINGQSPIFLRAGQGFSITERDKHISSFIVVESGITLNWIGSY